jgi:hypothetical protein
MPRRDAQPSNPPRSHSPKLDDLDALLRDLETHSAPLRAREANRLMDRLAQAQARCAAMRASAVGELRAEGWTLQQVADHLGRSISAIAQIERSRLSAGTKSATTASETKEGAKG